MSPKLKELLERCGTRPWINGNRKSVYDSDNCVMPRTNDEARLIAIAVNHFERLVALAEDAACGSCEKWAAKPCQCDSCIARGLLASIEAAVENERAKPPNETNP